MEDAPPVRPRRVVAWSAALAITVVVLILLPEAISVLLAGFAGLVLGAALSGARDALVARTPLGRRSGLVVIVVALLALTTGYGLWVAEVTAPEVQRLMGQLPEAKADLQEELRAIGLGQVAHWVEAPMVVVQDNGELQQRLFGIFSTTVGAFAAIGMILFVGIYTAVRPDIYVSGVVALFPPARRARIRGLMSELGSTLRWWLAGRTFSAAVIGVATGIAVWLLGVPLPLTLAILAGVLTYIPNVGPVLTLVPAGLLALTVSPTTALIVLAIYGGVQFVESYFLTPLVQQYAVEVPPALLLFAQALLAVLIGLFGVALAAPLVAVTIVLVRELYVKDRLGDADLSDAGLHPQDDEPTESSGGRGPAEAEPMPAE